MQHVALDQSRGPLCCPSLSPRGCAVLGAVWGHRRGVWNQAVSSCAPTVDLALGPEVGAACLTACGQVPLLEWGVVLVLNSETGSLPEV